MSYATYSADDVLRNFEDFLTREIDEALEERIKHPEDFEEAFDQLKTLVKEQIHDDGCWFIAKTAPEGYLQERLRELHRAIDVLLMAVEDKNFEIKGD